MWEFTQKPCKYSRLSPRRSPGGKAGMEVSFLGRQRRSVGSLHPLLGASQPAIRRHLPLLPDPAASVSRLGEEGPAPDSAQGGEGGGCCSWGRSPVGCSSPGVLCRLPGERPPSQDVSPTMWGCSLFSGGACGPSFKGQGKMSPLLPSLLNGSAV